MSDPEEVVDRRIAKIKAQKSSDWPDALVAIVAILAVVVMVLGVTWMVVTR